jgi:hypothetical protein
MYRTICGQLSVLAPSSLPAFNVSYYLWAALELKDHAVSISIHSWAAVQLRGQAVSVLNHSWAASSLEDQAGRSFCRLSAARGDDCRAFTDALMPLALDCAGFRQPSKWQRSLFGSEWHSSGGARPPESMLQP